MKILDGLFIVRTSVTHPSQALGRGGIDRERARRGRGKGLPPPGLLLLFWVFGGDDSPDVPGLDAGKLALLGRLLVL
jgi:hypothetical protein